MRRSASAPEKSEPPFAARSPLQPTRSAAPAAAAAGSVTTAAEAAASEPSTYDMSWLGEAAGA